MEVRDVGTGIAIHQATLLGRGQKRQSTKKKSARRASWISVAAVVPTILILLGFLLLFFYGVFQSLTNLTLNSIQFRFIGLANYWVLINSDTFWNSVRVTLIYGISAVILEAILGLLLAKLFASDVFLARLLRPVILLPLVLPPISAALMWTMMMEPQRGLLNYLLSVAGLAPFPWTSNPATALLSVVLIDAWTYTPFFALIIFAGLQGITEDILEAARVSGANALVIFLRIELPLVAPYIAVAAVFRLIDSFNQFDIIFGTTQGGPGNSTDVLSVQSYLTAFQDLNFGRGAAMMVVNWLIVLGGALFTVALLRTTRQRMS